MINSSRPCVSCERVFTGKFCPHCGEKRIDAHDLTLRHFTEHAVEAFTHADGKIVRSIRSLLLRPGEMTAGYIAGRRRPYIGPLQLFLICNVMYFLLQPLLRWDSLSSTLYTNMELAFFKGWAKPMAQAKIAASGLALENYGKIFDRAAILHGKSLVILLVPLFTLPLLPLFARRGRPLVLHLVFALHFTSFFLLGLLAVHGLLNLVQAICRAAGHPLSSGQLDLASAVPLFLAFGVYFHLAVRRAYGETGPRLAVKATLLVALVLPLLTAYRLILFLITLRVT